MFLARLIARLTFLARLIFLARLTILARLIWLARLTAHLAASEALWRGSWRGS
jgi:hypothetical protein